MPMKTILLFAMMGALAFGKTVSKRDSSLESKSMESMDIDGEFLAGMIAGGALANNNNGVGGTCIEINRPCRPKISWHRCCQSLWCNNNVCQFGWGYGNNNGNNNANNGGFPNGGYPHSNGGYNNGAYNNGGFNNGYNNGYNGYNMDVPDAVVSDVKNIDANDI